MPRYLSRRHETLMEESEQALWSAAERRAGTRARVAGQVLRDERTHGLWEACHADLLRPVALRRGRDGQVCALRDLGLRLVHRRALVDHVRANGLRGGERERLFRAFYGPRDFRSAVIAEHRQYLLAVSSDIAVAHLLTVMQDPDRRRLNQYDGLYRRYFELYCYVACCEEAESAAAASQPMNELRRQADGLRRRILASRPGGRGDFDSLALLARSGRHKALNYPGS